MGKLKRSNCWPVDTPGGRESNYSESGLWDNEQYLHCLLCVFATGAWRRAVAGLPWPPLFSQGISCKPHLQGVWGTNPSILTNDEQFLTKEIYIRSPLPYLQIPRDALSGPSTSTSQIIEEASLPAKKLRVGTVILTVIMKKNKNAPISRNLNRLRRK